MARWVLAVAVVVLVGCGDERASEDQGLAFEGCALDDLDRAGELATELGAEFGGVWACVDLSDCHRCSPNGSDRDVLLAATTPSVPFDPETCTFVISHDAPEGLPDASDDLIAECSELGDSVD